MPNRGAVVFRRRKSGRKLEYLLGLADLTAYLLFGMQALVARQLDDFMKYPPWQKPVSLNFDATLAQIQDASGGGYH
jgi:hypothetical protein